MSILLAICLLSVVSSHSYLYDALDRRTVATLNDYSNWHYEYNDRSELISARRFWDDYTPVAGQQFEYGYDPIGNRTVARSGGDEYGQNLRETSYDANELNQYSAADNPSYVQITGFASAPASVSVNSSAAYERGEYFHKELAVSNGSGPIAQSISAVATLTGTNDTETGTLILPEAEQDFTYDLDGNLTSDGIWSYEWDGENRLKAYRDWEMSERIEAGERVLPSLRDFWVLGFGPSVETLGTQIRKSALHKLSGWSGFRVWL